MSERFDDYKVEIFVKDNEILIKGNIRPIYLYIMEELLNE